MGAFLIPKNPPKNSCLSYAFYLLGRQDYSRLKLLQKLLRKGYLEAEAEETLQYVIDQGYLREDNYTISRVRAFIRKGYSFKYIQNRMKHQENIDVSSDEMQAIAIDMGIVAKDDILTELIKRKIGSKDILTDKEKARLVRFLVGKGYSFDDIFSKLKRLAKLSSEDE